MANEFFLQQFNPMDLVKGYEFGQKAQRDEDMALQDIESRRLLNELSTTKVGEFKDPQRTETRRLMDELAGREAALGSTLRGYEVDVAKDSGDVLRQALRDRTATAGMVASQGRAKQGLLGELQPQEFDIARGDVKLRAAQQQESAAKVEESLLGTRSLNSFRQSFTELPPETSPYDRLLHTFTKAPPEEKELIYRELVKQNGEDLKRVASVSDVDQWGQRPGNPFRIRATVEGNELVTYKISGKDDQGRDILDRNSRQAYPDIATFRATVGSQIPGFAAATRSGATAKPVPGAQGSSLAGAIMGPAGAAPAAPAAGSAAPSAPAATSAPAAPAVPQGAVFSQESVTVAPPAAQPVSTQAPAPVVPQAQAAPIPGVPPEPPPTIASTMLRLREALSNAPSRGDPEYQKAGVMLQRLMQAQSAGMNFSPEQILQVLKTAEEAIAPLEQKYADVQLKAIQEAQAKVKAQEQRMKAHQQSVLESLGLAPAAPQKGKGSKSPSGSSTIGIRG